ncbi:type-4 ice-structuring protein LS-12-like [Stegastes partitus]|uniref:Type-4 ice-structuring protein LS-12-like n=1 Tax=Stegastes partitus TaxID=144197 RepID=A0A3B5AX08_9TELE|nr:PREDICTED: type-4 ice-structuring protein LS-12-like [Stegastes partitus]
MKFSLIVAVVVLALAQGSFAQDSSDLERFAQYFEEMKTKMTEMIGNQDLTNQADNFRRTQLEPLAAQVQEQLKSVATNVEEQVKPLTANIQAQLQPMLVDFKKQMEDILQKLTEQGRAIAN